jgi:hypothetical protein
MRRHAPIPLLTIELAPVYRCGATGRRYLSRRGAYLKAAACAVAEAYEEALADDEYPGHPMPASMAYDDEAKFKRVTTRLARWLRWRDGRLAAMKGDTKA